MGRVIIKIAQCSICPLWDDFTFELPSAVQSWLQAWRAGTPLCRRTAEKGKFETSSGPKQTGTGEWMVQAWGNEDEGVHPVYG